jgi:hypothetical protein
LQITPPHRRFIRTNVAHSTISVLLPYPHTHK